MSDNQNSDEPDWQDEPDWDAIDALYDDARKAEDAGDHQKAIALYRDILAKDRDDHLGVALRLAPLSGQRLTKAPSAYIATLFDQNAEMFDAILVDELEYGVPLLIADALTKTGLTKTGLAKPGLTKPGLGPFPNWLDLGCGTGLCAMALEDVTTTRTGVDLAPTMIEIADELELYQHLYIGEAVAFLENLEQGTPFDLVTAADVLPYVGDVEPMLTALAKHVRQGTVLALSTEHLADAEATYEVGAHKRFAHSSTYLANQLKDNGWTVLRTDAITVRLEQNVPVPGELILAQKA